MAYELSWLCGPGCSEDMPERIGARLKLTLHCGIIRSKMLRHHRFYHLPHSEDYSE